MYARQAKENSPLKSSISSLPSPTHLLLASCNVFKMSLSRPHWDYTEDDMARAILDVTDSGFSPCQAAQRRGVPRMTLIDRLDGQTAVSEHVQPHQRLSKNQEDKLASWILRQESLGYAPSHS